MRATLCSSNVVLALIVQANRTKSTGSMAGRSTTVPSKLIINGVHLWWKTNSAYVWVELGRDKANAFVSANKVGKTFLLLIPAPWGPMAYALASAKLANAASKMGPNGLWVKFGPSGYVGARPRTSSNMHREPSPW